MQFERKRGRIELSLEAKNLGEDVVAVLSGGDKPHVGAVALGVPRRSLADPQQQSASVSVLTMTGHRDDELAREGAKYIASRLGRPTVFICGIHVENATAEELAVISQLSQELWEQYAASPS